MIPPYLLLNIKSMLMGLSGNAIFLIANPSKIKVELNIQLIRSDKSVYEEVPKLRFSDRIGTNYLSIPLDNVECLILSASLSDSGTKKKIKEYKNSFSKETLSQFID